MRSHLAQVYEALRDPHEDDGIIAIGAPKRGMGDILRSNRGGGEDDRDGGWVHGGGGIRHLERDGAIDRVMAIEGVVLSNIYVLL